MDCDNSLCRKVENNGLLVFNVITILKNDGARQWEGWQPLYEMENNKHVWNHQPDNPVYNHQSTGALKTAQLKKKSWNHGLTARKLPGWDEFQSFWKNERWSMIYPYIWWSWSMRDDPNSILLFFPNVLSGDLGSSWIIVPFWEGMPKNLRVSWSLMSSSVQQLKLVTTNYRNNKWVCLKMLCTPKPNGLSDHYPVFKWLFHWEYTLFSDKPKSIL